MRPFIHVAGWVLDEKKQPVTNAQVFVQRIYYSFTKSADITASADSSVTMKGPKGDITLDIPANTLDKNVTVTLNPAPVLPAVPVSQTSLKATGVGVEITPSDTSVTYKKPMTISLGYTAGDITGLDETSLVVGVYNAANSQWEVLPSVVDAANNIVTATTVHLSLFQVLQSKAPAALDSAKVYPNPFKPGTQVRMNFTGLVADAKIKIFTVGGSLVFEAAANATGVASWDGKNTNGTAVASGVYLALIKSGGDKKIIKIAVER